MMEKVAAAQKEGKASPGDLLTDLKSAFSSTGLDPKTAEQFAWNALAIYGIRGAAMGTLDALTLPENAPQVAALRMISSSMRLLDAYGGANGKLYSLPAQVSTSCPFGRMYHFWLAAYLARRLVSEGHSPEAAVYAVHLSAIGYQFKSGTDGKSPTRTMSEDSHSDFNNSVRDSVAHNDLGAVYGAFGTGQSLQFDSVLKSKIAGSYALPKDERALINSWTSPYQFLRWKDVLGADAGLDKLIDTAR
jgi:hypothetical protein